MTLVVGMQTVSVGIVEELRMFVHQWIEAGEGIHVDYGHTPDVSRFLHRLHVAAHVFATLVAAAS